MGIGTGGVGQKATAGGGISPDQQALSQFHFGQGAVDAMSKFAPIAHSTNTTQAVSGARAGAAKEAAQQSQADAAAMQQFINQQTGNLTSGIGSTLGKISGGGI